MSTHVALAKTIIEQFQMTNALQDKAKEYDEFQIKMTCKILELKEEEEALSNLLDEHMFLAATLDKKRSIAISKEVLEKKQRVELTENVNKLKESMELVQFELKEQTEKIQDQIHIKNLILQSKQEEGINTIEYIESQIYMNHVLKEAIASSNNSAGMHPTKPGKSSSSSYQREIVPRRKKSLFNDTSLLSQSSDYYLILNSIQTIYKAITKAVQIHHDKSESIEDAKNDILNIQSLIKYLESSLS